MALTHVRTGRTGPVSLRPASSPELIVSLDDAEALDAAVAGRKAAALARARRIGLPVLPGFVVTTAAAAELARLGPDAAPSPELAAALEAWRSWLAPGGVTLVVRSSSPGEDREASSMAGQFTSLLDVSGHDAFLAAVHTVVASALAPSALAADDDAGEMAVLVQPQVRPAWGGVLFGVDPVSGRSDRLLLAVVRGGPDRLVSGEVAGSQWTLSHHGRLLAGEREADGEALPRRHRRRLAALARRAAEAFGGPQDIEWAVGDDGRVLLLQSRPVTVVGPRAPGRAPVYGPGPVAETFPDPLSPLEADLWLPPLGVALREAVLLTGASSARRLDGAPVVTEVGGRAAVHLGLLGIKAGRVRVWSRFNPAPPARRLYASWRTGRLRAALPLLAADVVRRADEELSAMPAAGRLDDGELLVALHGSHQALVALHGYEILAGMLAGASGTATTGAARALRTLAAGRAGGLDDAALVA
ncbi:MAG TPA: PEP/pyruvate-binding domain-containing protein, partial [Acidimicrobiales bacterium]|nr:PEP/pyruvate-binding domain-containing protein [Acidimicrobiales bacterium]